MMTDTAPHPRAETRFSKAALDYMDALLDLEMRQHDRRIEHLARQGLPAHQYEGKILTRPVILDAEDSAFAAAAWSPCTVHRGQPCRWMKRLGGLLLPYSLTSGGVLAIEGAGTTRWRFAKALSVRVNGDTVPVRVRRRGLSRFIATAILPATGLDQPLRLDLETSGQARRAPWSDERASLAISTITISPGDV